MSALARVVERARVRGVRGTIHGGMRLAQRELGAVLQRRRLARRPIAVAPGDLERALGGDPRALLRGRVLQALPSLARWEAALDESVLARADAVAARRFDLLGSGPVDLSELDWQLDARSGRRWPLVHFSRVPVAYGDGSDIKWPWELSRCQHFPLLAGAFRVTGDRRYLDELGAQIESWIDENPVELGANWLVAMEPAIRAANWVAALALVADDVSEEAWFRRALGSLLLHGRFIRTHLETAPVRGNHYLADVVGLLVLASLLDGPEGRSWLAFAAGELAGELHHQVLPDGVDHEASVAYHRLVAEMFVVGLGVVSALHPSGLPADHEGRLRAMLKFTRDTTRPDGLSPLVGDSDDGRFLPLGDYGADPRDHSHLFRQARVDPGPPAEEAAYRDAGFYVRRDGDAYLLVRCGPTGGRGLGWHAHNDQLSFELAIRGTPIVVDPGSFVYTADPAARNLFRSTRFHSTLAVDGAEQNDLSAVELFRLPDQTHAECTRWGGGLFEGTHTGFRRLGDLRHTRRLELREGALEISDVVQGASGRELEWTFPLAGGTAKLAEGGVEARVGGVVVRFRGEVEWRVDEGWYSPRYGERVPVPFVRARARAAADEQVTVLRLTW